MSDQNKPNQQNTEVTPPKIITGPGVSLSQNSADKPKNVKINK